MRMNAKGLIADPEVHGYGISNWQPKAKAGVGWFVGSTLDTEYGEIGIWLCQKCETSQKSSHRT